MEFLKSINFDFDTKKLGKVFSDYTKGYRIIGGELKKYGFEHRQGSGYISKDRLSDAKICEIITDISGRNPWLLECTKRMDVTDIGAQFDLKRVLEKGAANAAKEQAKQSIRTAQAKATSSAEDGGMVME